MRIILAVFIIALTLGIIVSCNEKPPDPPDPVKIRDGQEYFPVTKGNTWYYNSESYRRYLEDDIIINDNQTIKLMENFLFIEAWRLTDSAFEQHLLIGVAVFDPPLIIPFNLEKEIPFQVASTVYVLGSPDSIGRVDGTLTFAGYVTLEVGDIMVDSCIKLDYKITNTDYGGQPPSQDSYSEYYARGIGLVRGFRNEEEIFLDSAIIADVVKP